MGNQLSSPVRCYPTHCRYLDRELTSPFPVVVKPCVRLGSDKYQFNKSLVWLDWEAISWSFTCEACALTIRTSRSVNRQLSTNCTTLHFDLFIVRIHLFKCWWFLCCCMSRSRGRMCQPSNNCPPRQQKRNHKRGFVNHFFLNVLLQIKAGCRCVWMPGKRSKVYLDKSNGGQDILLKSFDTSRKVTHIPHSFCWNRSDYSLSVEDT